MKGFHPAVGKVTIRSGLDPTTRKRAYLIILHTAGEVKPCENPDEYTLEEAGAYMCPMHILQRHSVFAS